jgi:hypothetical protein
MKFIYIFSLLLFSLFTLAQSTIGVIIEPSFNTPQFKKSSQSDSIKSISNTDLTLSFGLEIKKKLDRYNAISFIPGFLQTNLLTVKENLQFLDLIHPSLPEIKDLTQSANKIARVRYRFQYIGTQILYNRQLKLRKIPPKFNVEIGGGMGLHYLIDHSVKIKTEGFALNNKFVHVLENETGLDPNLINVNLLYEVTPKFTLNAGFKTGLPITNTNNESFAFRIYNNGLRMGITKLI